MNLVLVEWEDSHAEDGWHPLREMAASNEVSVCRSVGWIVAKNKSRIVICPHLSNVDRPGVAAFGCGHLTIPAKAVKRCIPLKDS